MANEVGSVDRIKSQLRQQMRLGNTDMVVQLLLESGIPEADLFAKRINAFLQQYDSGKIEAEAWSQAQLQLYQSVLDLAYIQDTDKPPVSFAFNKLQLQLLVDAHEIGQALACCEAFGDSSIPMQAQYEIGRQQYEKGAIELASWELIQHKTKYLLWELAEQMPGEQAPGKSIWRRIKRWFGFST
ncbi:MAG: hypothetical protein ACKV1O_05450 [Saprospiraceae bacterium]